MHLRTPALPDTAALYVSSSNEVVLNNHNNLSLSTENALTNPLGNEPSKFDESNPVSGCHEVVMSNHELSLLTDTSTIAISDKPLKPDENNPVCKLVYERDSDINELHVLSTDLIILAINR